jgi:preprotein translocase subunit SecD
MRWSSWCWAWEAVSEPVPAAEDENAPGTLRVVALRTFVLAGDPVVTTADVEAADIGLEKDTQAPYVIVTLSNAAGERFFHVTEEWLGRRLGIVVNGRLESVPAVRSPIRGGRVSITMGTGASPDEQLAAAKRLAASLR